jgi:ribosome-associated protein
VHSRRLARVRHAELVPGPIPLRGSLVIPEAELTWRFSRSSGPGGQSVNTADSRVELSWDLAASDTLPPVLKERALERLSGRLASGVLTVAASEHRSQFQNRRAAEARIAETVLAAIAPPPRQRRPTKPSRGSIERRLTAKKSRGDIKRLRRDPGD